ncbi:putative bifunctional diguanylate cyclase/phosphodiesterase [Saccharopolyspora erythraea]|uniref:putative bifunctional diguanylate cyclase/phosphodiesterase n=2 Tax=Saccharopolyspora erythraea TaxID=1836 RepID=UPI000681512B|nr:EAL domain-containing protein [Saccharopolyspora erythraea]
MSVREPGDPADDRVPGVLTPQRHNSGWRTAVARKWASRLSSASYIPMSRDAIELCMLELVELIIDALEDPERTDHSGRAVGTRLVEIHATGEDSLTLSLDLIRDVMVADTADESVHRMLGLLTAIAAGYAAADRESTFVQQETLKRALLRSKLQADRDLAASEARFGEVFTTTPIGVAICDLTGKFVQVNPALGETLGYRSQDFGSMTVHDLFHPEDAKYLTAAYAELAEGGRTQRLRERRRLLRADGEPAWAYLAVSVLKGADGAPAHFVTMVEDISELHLLQERFQYQALHDAMTGLPNRQFFRTRLEAALGNLPKDARLTLYHLGLDGFELINDGLGHEVGDGIIKAVARRLEQLIQREEAILARFGGTEFAVLVLESPRTPPVHEFAPMINEELAEPIYVGEHGIATSASIGVVQRCAGDGDAANMLWAADVALRRAEAAGKRQWALFDPDRAPDERTQAKLAAVMPGGLELGEFDVVYRPVVQLGDSKLIAIEAELSWETGEFGRLDHADCLRLAERSGVTLSLRDWMLGSAWEQLARWHRAGHRPPLVVGLSPNQAADPDLVGTIRRVLDEGSLDASWLRVSMPMRVMLGDNDEARDNVRFLDRLGVRTALHGFHASPGELRYLRDLPVDIIQFADDVVRLVRDSAEDSPEVEAVKRFVPLVRSCGRRLAVGDVDSEEQARRWHEMGCEVGAGALYGGPVPNVEVPNLLAQLASEN